jgi:hypothetical protein
MAKPSNEVIAKLKTSQDPLIRMLYNHMAAERLSLNGFCMRHGISYNVLSSVVRNQRWIVHCDKETIVVPLAEALRVPVVTIYIKAGLLTNADFLVPETLDGKLEQSFETMLLDKTLLAVIPSNKEEFMSWPLEAQTAMILLYQSYSKKTLLDMAQIEDPVIGGQSFDVNSTMTVEPPHVTIEDVVSWSKPADPQPKK